MNTHPVISPGRVAVVTGAASGIGQAAARRFAEAGMRVYLADADAPRLERATAEIAAATGRGDEVRGLPTDVARLEDVERLKEAVYGEFGEVGLLMNNAAIGRGGGPWDHYSNWQRLLGVNLWGVIHGLQAFVPDMIAQDTPCAIVNTGSKQGITTPPGNAAYNVSKAGVKVLTEQLAHELRQVKGCRVTAHLLVPGYTFTRITAPDFETRTEKPAAAWTADQVVSFLLERMAAGDFYVLCPDNETTREMDERRIRWAAEDLIENRPALSRWHPDFQAAFAEFMRRRG